MKNQEKPGDYIAWLPLGTTATKA